METNNHYQAIVVRKDPDAIRVVRSSLYPVSEYGVTQCESWIEIKTRHQSRVIGTFIEWLQPNDSKIPDSEYIAYCFDEPTTRTQDLANSVTYLADVSRAELNS